MRYRVLGSRIQVPVEAEIFFDFRNFIEIFNYFYRILRFLKPYQLFSKFFPLIFRFWRKTIFWISERTKIHKRISNGRGFSRGPEEKFELYRFSNYRSFIIISEILLYSNGRVIGQERSVWHFQIITVMCKSRNRHIF